MTVTTTDLTKWLGTKLTAQLSSDQLGEALQDATDYCQATLLGLGVPGGSGSAYDAAIKLVARASIWRQLDAMGVKPQSLDLGGNLRIGSDTGQAVEQFMRQADERLQWAALALAHNKVDMYVHRNRGGQGI